jgi:hypothetical protein
MDSRRISQEMLQVVAPIRGIARYLEKRELLGIPRSLEMWVWITKEVLKNKICDLSRFREVLLIKVGCH